MGVKVFDKVQMKLAKKAMKKKDPENYFPNPVVAGMFDNSSIVYFEDYICEFVHDELKDDDKFQYPEKYGHSDPQKFLNHFSKLAHAGEKTEFRFIKTFNKESYIGRIEATIDFSKHSMVADFKMVTNGDNNLYLLIKDGAESTYGSYLYKIDLKQKEVVWETKLEDINGGKELTCSNMFVDEDSGELLMFGNYNDSRVYSNVESIKMDGYFVSKISADGKIQKVNKFPMPEYANSPVDSDKVPLDRTVMVMQSIRELENGNFEIIGENVAFKFGSIPKVVRVDAVKNEMTYWYTIGSRMMLKTSQMGFGPERGEELTSYRDKFRSVGYTKVILNKDLDLVSSDFFFCKDMSVEDKNEEFYRPCFTGMYHVISLGFVKDLGFTLFNYVIHYQNADGHLVIIKYDWKKGKYVEEVY